MIYQPVINFERCLGFSRGAYQVRVLSAMIDKVSTVPSTQVPVILLHVKLQVGLIYKGNETQIPLCALNDVSAAHTVNR